MAKVRSFFLRFFIYGALGLLLVGVLGFIFIPGFIETNKIKPQLEKGFSDFLTRRITIESLQWRWFPSPALIGENVRLTNQDGFLMVRSPEVEIGLSFRHLMKRKIVIQDLVFVRPKGVLRRKADGTLPLYHMVQDIRERLRQKKNGPVGKSRPFQFQFETIAIEKGRFQVLDQMIRSTPLPLILTVDAVGNIEGLSGARSFPFELKARVNQRRQEGALAIRGVLKKYSKVQAVATHWPVGLFKDHVRFLHQWQGRTSFTTDLENTLEGVKWTVRGQSDNFKPMAAASFPDLNISYSVRSHKASSFSIETQTPRSDIAVAVHVPKQKELVFISTVTSAKLDIEEFIDWAKIVGQSLNPVTSTSTGPVKAAPAVEAVAPSVRWALQSTFDLKDVRYRSIVLNTFKMKATRDSTGTVMMNPIEAQSGNGLIQGKVAFWGGMSKAMSHLPRDYRVDWNMTDINLVPLAQSFIGTARFSGRGKTRGYILGNVDDRAWQRTGGQFLVELHDGKVWGVPGLLQAFSKLNVASLLREIKDREGKGFPFDVARATITLSRGKVRVDPPGVFENKTLHIGVMGNVDLRKKEVDGKLVFYFLTFVGEVLKAVPGVETILYNDRKSFAPIWVAVRGPVESPNLDILPFRSITDTLWGTIESIFKFPFRRRMKK